MSILLAPSILSADFAKLGDAIAAVERGGADLIHVDVMDGHFVPNITIGPPVVKSLKRVATVPLDVHLMITDPDKYIGPFAEAGAAVAVVARLVREIVVERERHRSLDRQFGDLVRANALEGVDRSQRERFTRPEIAIVIRVPGSCAWSNRVVMR